MKKLSIITLFILGVLFTMESCKSKVEGDAAAVSEAGTEAVATGDAYTVDPATAMVSWEGSKPAGKHTGTLKVADGSFTLADGTITSGSFTLDMTSINVTDLEGDYKAQLEGHLKGSAEEGKDDFFNVSAYPTAKFDITKVTKLEGDTEGTHLVYGNLTLKGMTKEVGFKAAVSSEGDMLKISTPQFVINRTDWGIKYGSPTFFEGLKDKAISDEMGIKIDLTAKKPTI